MSGQIGFLIDTSRCVGCHACRVACQFHNATGPEVNWRQVTLHQRGKFPDVMQHALSLACNHCVDPACIKVCPVDAISKRETDGIVSIDTAVCNGCGRCVAACPYGAPRKVRARNVVSKCHFCMPRQDRGLQPACVETCIGGALKFGPVDEMTRTVSELLRQVDGFADPTLTLPSTRFIEPL